MPTARTSSEARASGRGRGDIYDEEALWRGELDDDPPPLALPESVPPEWERLIDEIVGG